MSVHDNYIEDMEEIDYEELHEQQKELYCEKHDCWFVKNVHGGFYCPLCLLEARSPTGDNK